MSKTNNTPTGTQSEDQEKIKALEEMNAGLTAKIEQMGKSKKAGREVVTHNKKDYAIIVPRFSYKKKHYTTEDLLKNKELVGELVEINSGVLQEL